ncbi:MAG: membrane protein insertion efficiency factor YidD [Bacteroidales bacterium]|nr:membrane protein insertion efficiency factor YidD [Bacteroidales bacterium]
MKIFKKILFYIIIAPIKLYKYAISPFTPASCRHVPTCSEYAIEAVRVHGIKGVWLGTKRILKCHPWGTSGYDPVLPKGMRKIKVKKFKPEDY